MVSSFPLIPCLFLVYRITTIIDLQRSITFMGRSYYVQRRLKYREVSLKMQVNADQCNWVRAIKIMALLIVTKGDVENYINVPYWNGRWVPLFWDFWDVLTKSWIGIMYEHVHCKAHFTYPIYFIKLNAEKYLKEILAPFITLRFACHWFSCLGYRQKSTWN